MNKTQQSILAKITAARARGQSHVDVEGARDCKAARALVAAGHAAGYENQSGMTGGDFYVHPFTRRPATTKPRAVIAGRIAL